jgi:drug/metabolite transporter (DMT)-like permease
MRSTHTQGIFYAHFGALLFGGTALFAKWIPLGADVITFWRTIVAMAAVLILCKVRGQSLRLERRRDAWMQIGLGVILGVHWMTYYLAIQLSTVAIGVTALFAAPVISVWIESAMRRVWPDWLDVGLCLVVFLGVLCLVPDFSWESDYTRGVGIGLLSALFLALRQNLHRRTRARTSSGMVLLFYQLIGIGGLFVFSGLTAAPAELCASWFPLLLLGTLFTAAPHFCNLSALRELEAKSVLIITSLMVPYGILFSAIFFGEIPSGMTLLGSGLILAAATAENLRLGRSQSANSSGSADSRR